MWVEPYEDLKYLILERKTGVVIEEGMVLAIEPMANEKGHQVTILDDDWTVVTQDGGWSAHFEHTVLVTKEGPVILTRSEGNGKL